jgi:hypothetical protein
MVRRQTNLRKEKKREREGKEKKKNTEKKKSATDIIPSPDRIIIILVQYEIYCILRQRCQLARDALDTQTNSNITLGASEEGRSASSPIRIIDPPVRSGQVRSKKQNCKLIRQKKKKDLCPSCGSNQTNKQSSKQEPLTHHQNKNPVFFHFFERVHLLID